MPAALVYLGVLSLVFVLLPELVDRARLDGLGLGAFIGIFGGLIGLPDWARDISPFTHSPVPVGTSTDWTGGAWMLGIAVVAAVLAALGMRRRELSST